MSHFKLGLSTLILMAMAHLSLAAEIGSNETFNADAAGWQDRDAGKMMVQFDAVGNPGGSLSGVFTNILAPVPDTDAMRAVAASSGGSFTGNYAGVYAFVDGFAFDFKAKDVLPSSALLRFGRGSNVFFRSFTPQLTATNVWESIFVPLNLPTEWRGGPVARFTNTLAQVEFLDIQITRKGNRQQTYYVDNFVLDPFELVGATTAYTTSNNILHVVWSPLKAGVSYDVQSTTNLNFGWTNISLLVATNTANDWIFPLDPNEPYKFYRIIIDNPSL